MKTLRHLKEQEIEQIEGQIFALEEKLPLGSRTRKRLYEARVMLGMARHFNRQNKDNPQLEEVYAEIVGPISSN